MGSAVGGLLGLGGGAGPSLAQIDSPVTMDQANNAYTNAQTGLQGQQDFLKALQAQNGVQNQSQVFNQLQDVAAGNGPNPAQAQLANATGANVANQAALMAGQRGAGANVGLMARQAARQGAQTQQQAAGQGAALQAQQSMNALGAMGSLANQQVAQQAAATGGYSQAAQNEQANLLNSINAQNAAKVSNQSNVNNANAALASGGQQGQQNLVGNLMGGIGSVFNGISGGLGNIGSMLGGLGGAATGLVSDMGGGAAAIGSGAGDFLGGGGGAMLLAADGGEIPDSDLQISNPSPFEGISPATQVQGASNINIGSPSIPSGKGGSGGGMGGLGSMIGMVGSLFADGGPVQVQSPGHIDIGSVNIPTIHDPFAPLKEDKPKKDPNKPQSNLGKALSGIDTTTNKTSMSTLPQDQTYRAQYMTVPNDPPTGMAKGGKVPAMVSPGEQYLNKTDVKKVKDGKNPLAVGERIPGKPKHPGNDYRNDTVPKNLESGGIVIPNKVMQSKNPPKEAQRFVAAVMAHSGKGMRGKK